MASSDCSKDPFFVCSLDWVVRQYEQWTRLCPAIIPFYAVKCNNDPVLLHTVSNIHYNTPGALLVSRCFSVFKEMGQRHDKLCFLMAIFLYPNAK